MPFVAHRIALPVVSEWCEKLVQSKESPRRDFLKAVQTSCVVMSDSLQLDGCTGSADHQHASTLTHLDGLVVYVHAYTASASSCSASATISSRAVSRACLKDLS